MAAVISTPMQPIRKCTPGDRSPDPQAAGGVAASPQEWHPCPRRLHGDPVSQGAALGRGSHPGVLSGRELGRVCRALCNLRRRAKYGLCKHRPAPLLRTAAKPSQGTAPGCAGRHRQEPLHPWAHGSQHPLRGLCSLWGAPGAPRMGSGCVGHPTAGHGQPQPSRSLSGYFVPQEAGPIPWPDPAHPTSRRTAPRQAPTPVPNTTQPTGPPPLEPKPQGRADTSQQMQILPRAPEVRPACAGEVPPCHPSPRGTEPPARPRGRILPTPLPAGMVAPTARAWPKTPGAAAQAGPALSHLSLSLLRRGSCPETQRCRRPGGRGPLCPSLGHSRGD
eukprot:XP_027299809.1 basic proline-rich protein-like [Anas platyrhynchos]